MPKSTGRASDQYHGDSAASRYDRTLSRTVCYYAEHMPPPSFFSPRRRPLRRSIGEPSGLKAPTMTVRRHFCADLRRR